MQHFGDHLANRIKELNNPTVVGLDPRLDQIPQFVKDMAIKQYGEGLEAVSAALIIFNVGIIDAVADIPGVEPERHVPEVANHLPSLRLSWDQKKIKMTPDELRQKLRDGHPSIETVGGSESVGITTWMMQPGQERIVASRLSELLRKG